MPKYNVITLGDRIIEISQPSSTTLVYRLPFEKVGKKTADIIQNNFIVYILFGRNAKGKDVVYVGKSKNNIISRPRQHKDKFSDWTDCYVLTQFKERTFLNDGTIQYLENQISTKVDECGLYINTTDITTSGTANPTDEENCARYLPEALAMLDILGLNLINPQTVKSKGKGVSKAKNITNSKKTISTSSNSPVPNGTYYFDRKQSKKSCAIKASVVVKDGCYTVQPNSLIAITEQKSIDPSISQRRKEAKIKNGKLLKAESFNSPSSSADFVCGGSINGWDAWKTSDGRPISVFRK